MTLIPTSMSAREHPFFTLLDVIGTAWNKKTWRPAEIEQMK